MGAVRDTAERIKELARERILVLDGAWGMIFDAGLTPADYRGERFAGHAADVRATPTSSISPGQT